MAQSVSVVAQYVLSPVCNKFIIHLKFSTFYSIFSLMRCLRDFKTALTRVYYFTVGREASFASQLFIFWMKGVYLPIVYFLGPVSQVVQEALVCIYIVLEFLPYVIEEKAHKDAGAFIVD